MTLLTQLMRNTMALILLLFAAIHAQAATTYYVDSGSGSDSNSGTSQSSPWAHAPYMKTASGNAAAYSCTAGDSIVLKGGERWTYSSLPWSWNCNGTSSAHVTVGGDGAWFNSSKCAAAGYTAYCRPIIDAGGPNGTSCFYEGGGGSFKGAFIDGYAAYLDVQFMEFTGLCEDSSGVSQSYINLSNSSHDTTIHDNYMHGWTVIGNSADSLGCMTASAPTYAYNNVIDGTVDGETDGAVKCSANGAWTSFDHNYMSNMSDFINTNYIVSFHHNTLVNFVASKVSGVHGNMFENNSGAASGTYVYNNQFVPGQYPVGSNAVYLWTAPQRGAVDYVFNNIIHDVPWVGDNILMCEDSLVNKGGSCVFFNNTVQCGTDLNASGICGSQSLATTGTTTVKNNHFITSLANCLTGAFSNHSGNSITFASNTCQSTLSASLQGYTSGQSFVFSPTTNTDATVGTGSNLTSICNSFPNTAARAACQADTSYGVGYDKVNRKVIVQPKQIAVRPTSANWDAGAYQFAGANAATVTPPTNLTYTVQ